MKRPTLRRIIVLERRTECSSLSLCAPKNSMTRNPIFMSPDNRPSGLHMQILPAGISMIYLLEKICTTQIILQSFCVALPCLKQKANLTYVNVLTESNCLSWYLLRIYGLGCFRL